LKVLPSYYRASLLSSHLSSHLSSSRPSSRPSFHLSFSPSYPIQPFSKLIEELVGPILLNQEILRSKGIQLGLEPHCLLRRMIWKIQMALEHLSISN